MKKEKKKDEVPVLQVGKNGISDQLISEIKGQLKKNRTIKVRMLKSALGEDPKADRKKIAEEVSARCKTKLLDIRGNTFTITRNK